jgi:acyl-CoA thioesterase-1
MRVLVYGDSIAQGFWSTRGGWVELLRQHFDELAIKDLRHNTQPTIFNVGISGDTTRSLLARIEPETKARKWPDDPQIVIIAIGTNDDLFEGNRQWVSPSEFESNLENLISTLQPSVQNIMFVGNVAVDEELTTPVFWGNYTYTNEQLKKYEQIVERVAQKHSVAFVPIFDRFLAEQQKRNLLADGLHPNEEGHKFIASLVLPELEKLLA